MIKSPLFTEIRNYLIRAKQEDQIFIFVPYIKTKILEELLEGIENKITVITTCNGDGSIIVKACKKCNGIGVNLKEETTDFQIPKGIMDGEYLLLSGKGNDIKQGPSLYNAFLHSSIVST